MARVSSKSASSKVSNHNNNSSKRAVASSKGNNKVASNSRAPRPVRCRLLVVARHRIQMLDSNKGSGRKLLINKRQPFSSQRKIR